MFHFFPPEEQKRVLVNGHDGDNGLEHREWTNRITDDPVEGLPPAGITSSGLESDNEFQVNGQVMADAHGKEVSNEQNNYLMAGLYIFYFKWYIAGWENRLGLVKMEARI